jgi:hypothetical protein
MPFASKGKRGDKTKKYTETTASELRQRKGRNRINKDDEQASIEDNIFLINNNDDNGNSKHLITFLTETKKRKEKDSDNEEECDDDDGQSSSSSDGDDESSISSDYSSSSFSSSEESLLSGLSEDDDAEEENVNIIKQQQPPPSKQKEQPLNRRQRSILRLEKKLEKRQQTLQKLSTRRSSSSTPTASTVIKLLQMNEELVRQIKLEKYYNKKIQKTKKKNNNNETKQRSCSIATETSSSSTSNANSNRNESNDNNDNENDEFKQHEDVAAEDVPPPTNNKDIGGHLTVQDRQPWLWWILFEIHHTIPSSFKLVIICLCHLAFHGVLDATTRIVYHNMLLDYVNKQLFSSFLIVIGLVLLRANGYLWLFLNDDSYRIVKFDMHNRLRLRCTDAKVLSFFKKRAAIWGSAANMFGFYFAYVGLNQIFSHNYSTILKSFENWFVQTKEGILAEQNFTDDDNSSSLVFYSWDGLSTGYSEPEYQTCLMLEQYVDPKLQWWFHYCCTDPFQEWKILEITYFGVLLSVVATIAGYLGLNLLELCDEE